ncbi:hypothetical protein CRENPOLYSF2_2440015 [Crenothrix polyspora]|uniref:Uncharacterized protein n=1 Tax=Crenothrix polyspora TaxID=360316 RepID=A0A1R4H7W7_9GAMM|nr:hypothetical protein CRENPOLYSF2_2440015 [Crenothrix polyspora]
MTDKLLGYGSSNVGLDDFSLSLIKILKGILFWQITFRIGLRVFLSLRSKVAHKSHLI